METITGALKKGLSANQFSIEDRDLVREALAAYREGGGDSADYVLGTRNSRAGCSVTVTFERALRKSEVGQVIPLVVRDHTVVIDQEISRRGR
jgi:predicted nucleic-acid-binding protein